MESLKRNSSTKCRTPTRSSYANRPRQRRGLRWTPTFVGVTEEEYLKAKIAEAKQDAAEEISELEAALKKAREKKPAKKAKKQ